MTTTDAAKQSKCVSRMKILKVRLREVFFYGYANKSWKREIVHLSSRMRDFFFPDELMYLYPDGVNQCNFSFIMCMPSVSGKQPLGMGFGRNLGWGLGFGIPLLRTVL